jgi:hypothetical protein
VFVESASDSLKSYLICVYHQKITDRDNRYFITDANTDNTTTKATYGLVNGSLIFKTNSLGLSLSRPGSLAFVEDHHSFDLCVGCGAFFRLRVATAQ